MGRPPKNPEDKYRTPLVSVRVPADVRATIDAARAKTGETFTAFVLRAALAEARRVNRRK